MHHLGAFPQLEDQMCSLVGGDGRNARTGSSPDRVDALVWALTDLLLVPMIGEGIYEIYRQLNGQRSEAGPAGEPAASISKGAHQ